MTTHWKIRDGITYLTTENAFKFLVMVFVIFVAPVLTRQWLYDSQSLVTTIPLMMLWSLGVLMYLAVGTAAFCAAVVAFAALLLEELETFESVSFSLGKIAFLLFVAAGLGKVLYFLLTMRW